jgi:hypothetical protein
MLALVQTDSEPDPPCLHAASKRSSRSGGPALRRNRNDRFGSDATELAEATRPLMSAVPPIATINWTRRICSVMPLPIIQGGLYSITPSAKSALDHYEVAQALVLHHLI